VAKERYRREGDALGRDDAVVIRGGVLDAALLRVDAQRNHSIYGVYGISVFALRDAAVDELAQQPPLVRFEVLTLVTVGVLRAAGLELEVTGQIRGTSMWCSTIFNRASNGSARANTVRS
jgi:hypothetical protein